MRPIVSISRLRSKLAFYVRQVHRTSIPIVVTQNSEPIISLVPFNIELKSDDSKSGTDIESGFPTLYEQLEKADKKTFTTKELLAIRHKMNKLYFQRTVTLGAIRKLRFKK